MKLFSFPVFAIEKAIAKRMLGLASPHKEWIAKGKTWDDETFNTEMAAWDVLFYPAEVEVLRPIIEGDGLLQLMQKNVPAERVQALLNKLETQRQA